MTESDLITYAHDLAGIEDKELLVRLLMFFHLAQALTEKPIEDVFISELPNPDLSTQYVHLYFFTTTHGFEIENWVSRDRISKMPWNIAEHWAFIAKDFDFTTATQNSRLWFDVQFRASTGFGYTLSASGAHCKKLMKIVKQYFDKDIPAPH